jgi:hypothetical protein
MKYILAILSATAVLAVGFLPSTASAEFIYRGDQHKDHHTRYWVDDKTFHRHGHTVVVPGHWVWLK